MMHLDSPRNTLTVKPGEHLLILHEGDEEEYLSDFIQSALEKNERCLYIAGTENADALESRILTLKAEGLLQGDAGQLCH